MPGARHVVDAQPDVDAGRAEQRAGALELLVEVGGAVAARQLARLAQRLVRHAAHLEHPLGGALVAPLGEGGGQLGLDRDRREPPAEDVVHVAREPQALLDHRQLGLGLPGAVELGARSRASTSTRGR